MKIDVLDKGFVELIDRMGTDLNVVNGARVSFGKRKIKFDERDENLIHFLAGEDPIHFAPFCHVQFQFHIKMPFFIARQYFKHQIGLSRNEISRRYVTDTPDAHVPSELRKAAANKKQGSSDEKLPKMDADYCRYKILDSYALAIKTYEDLVEYGVCPEQARMVLPVGVYTEFIETGSLYAYARIIKHRDHSSAQKEIQEYARALATIISKEVPVSAKALFGSSYVPPVP